jgi:hypothetical protein
MLVILRGGVLPLPSACRVLPVCLRSQALRAADDAFFLSLLYNGG